MNLLCKKEEQNLKCTPKMRHDKKEILEEVFTSSFFEAKRKGTQNLIECLKIIFLK